MKNFGEFLKEDWEDDFTIEISNSLSAVNGGLPNVTRLMNPRPNPFNPQTVISYDLAEERRAFLRIYDMSGRVVRTLLDGEILAAGRHESTWRGKDDSGRQVASGTYLFRFVAGQYSETKRMVLIK